MVARFTARVWLLALVNVLWLTLPLSGENAKTTPSDEAAKDAKPATPAGHAVVHFTDGSSLKMILRDESIELTTRYGKLRIPIAEIEQIDFATRIAPEMQKRVDAAIADLGHREFDKRQAAGTELLALRENAYQALQKAAKSTDAEVSSRATKLLEQIREAVPDEELLVFRSQDVIRTTDMAKLVGTIDSPVLKATTIAFGDVSLKLPVVRRLRVGGNEPEIDIAKLPPAPMNMIGQAALIGKTFVYRVTGANNGAIYGSDVYTSDSSLAMVAVHAGIVKIGETGVIKVTIVDSPPAYPSVNRNGITSNAFGAYQGAYKVSK
jgi:hypothetical protein